MYALNINLHPEENQETKDLFDALVTDSLNWIIRGLNLDGVRVAEIPMGSTILKKEQGVFHEREVFDDKAFSEIRWIRPHRDDKYLRWKSIIKIGMVEPGLVQMTIQIHLVSTVYLVRRPPFIFFSPPRLARTVIENYSCEVNGVRDIDSVLAINDDNIEDFIANYIQAEDRRVPIILIAPDPKSGVHYLDPKAVCYDVIGLAVVAHITDTATYRMSEVVGRQHSCFNGGARIYWPGFDRDMNPYINNLFLRDDLIEFGPKIQKRIFHYIRENAVLGYAEPKGLIELQRELDRFKERERSERIKDLEERMEVGLSSLEGENERIRGHLTEEQLKSAEIMGYLERTREEIVAYRSTVGEYRDQLKAIGAENEALKETIRSMHEYYISEGKKELPPGTVIEAVERAQSIGTNLLFTKKSLEIARKSHYSDPPKVYDILMITNEVAGELAEGMSYDHHWGDEIAKRALDAGYRVQFTPRISESAKGAKFRSEYETTFIVGGEARRRVIEPHILLQKKGDIQEAARIFFDWEEDCCKMVVSRVGKHPKNLSS
jgi:hypothetical protein